MHRELDKLETLMILTVRAKPRASVSKYYYFIQEQFILVAYPLNDYETLVSATCNVLVSNVILIEHVARTARFI